MGELVPLGTNQALALVAGGLNDPEREAAEQEKRIQEAQELEAKLKVIQESIPTRVYNTCSSSAGAGSSDFHMYRQIRKAEQERWKRIEAASKADEEKKAFEAKRKAQEEEAQARTAKNRAKRQKKKAAKASKPKQGGASDAGGPAAGGPESASDGEAAEPGVPEQADLD